MKSLLFVLQFGWPFLRKYWVRFACGILMGIFFGLSNASFVWATKTIFERLAPSPATPTAEQITETVSAGFSGIQTWAQNTAQTFQETLDPWLPRYKRPLDWKQALGALLLLPMLMLVRGSASFLNAYCMIWVSERVTKDLRLAVLKKLNTLSLDYFDRSTSGDLITRIDGDTKMLQRCFSLGFADLIKEPVTLISVFGALCILDWQLAVFSLIFLPLCAVPVRVLAKKVRRASEGTVDAQIHQSSLLIQLINGIRVIKAFGLEKFQEEKFDRHGGDFAMHSIRGTRSKELVNPIIEVISMIGLGLIIVYVSFTERSSADLVGFLTGLVLLFTPVKKLAALNMLFNQTRIGVRRLQHLFDENPAVREPAQPVKKDSFENAVELKDVTFAYGKTPVLKNISLNIPRGYFLGLAGESGSGKSTLVNLLFRFYDPTNGTIEFDGIDLKKFHTNGLRRLMALVGQHTVLFDMTVAENIACGKPDGMDSATREEIETAAKSANAHEFILNLPQGYDTRIGEQGVTLSGGQRQRLAIARAFIRNAPILVLDEATAALDSHAEAEVQSALDKLSDKKTVICVAHRLTTLRNCDEIIVLREGELVERGRFEDLLRKNGAFAQMAQKQGF